VRNRRRFGALLPAAATVVLCASVYNPLVVFRRLATAPWSYVLTALILTLIGVLLMARSEWRRLSRWRAFGLPMAGFGVVLLVAAVVGIVSRNAPLKIATDLFQAGEMVVAYYLAAAALRRYRDRRWALELLLLIVTFTLAWEVAVYGLHGTDWFATLAGTEQLPRANLGGTSVPALVSPIPALLLPLLLGVCLIGGDALPKRTLAIVSPAAVLAIVAVALSFKRSVWAAEVAAILCLAFFAVWSRPKSGLLHRGAITATILLSAAVIIVLFPVDGVPASRAVQNRLALTKKQLDVAVERPSAVAGVRTRVSEYQEIWDALRRSPVVGRGLGAEYQGFQRQQVADKHFVHNTYLAVAFRGGIVGLTAFLVALVATVATVLRRLLALHAVAEPVSVAIAGGALAAVLSLAIQSLTTGILLTHPVALICGALLGLATVTETRC
jgi:O-antigen ligase